ncbi:hypothetical protein L6164_023359 [Bauhinia variegata]|uniref:Uncharacterized protein n=1 Tax=Bauhinia variegata TaxID=167791 RepID=A0ACB9MIF4_BAUVA|nr:hypothetical protein L6164_023359 [Bauhinia variegata]
MASSLAPIVVSGFLSRPSRSFSSSAMPQHHNDGGDRSLEVHGHRFVNFFSDVLDPLSLAQRLSQDANETDGALHLRVDMPGLDKKDVEVSVKHNTITIKGEGCKDGNDDEQNIRRWLCRNSDEDRNDLFHVKIE